MFLFLFFLAHLPRVSAVQIAKSVDSCKKPEKCGMIGRHAQALLKHSYLLIDALNLKKESKDEHEQRLLFCLRGRYLRQLLPLWLKFKVCTL